MEHINEDFYKNLFRLLNSPRPEAGQELKKICDDLTALYEAKGITEYWPPIPADTCQSPAEGSGEFVPTSARKLEKPIAPFRKDSLAVDRLSPHAAALRSNSPRLSSLSVDIALGGISKGSTDDSQSQSDVNESGVLNISADSGDDSLSSASSVIMGQSGDPVTVGGKRKISPTGDETSKNTENGQAAVIKRKTDVASSNVDADSRSRSEEPAEKRPKIVVDSVLSKGTSSSVQSKTEEQMESSSARDELDALVCVVCKTFALLSAGNLMVECHECHNMYHQKCHQPNVPNSQIVDPRLLWYCSQCEKKNRNRTESTSASTKSSPTVTASMRRHAQGQAGRDDKKQTTEPASIGPKRNSVAESKDKQPSSGSVTPKPSTADLYSKAATLLEKHKKKSTPTPPVKGGNSSNNTNPFAMALSSAASSAGLAKSTPTTTSGGLSKLAVQQQNTMNSTAKSGTSSSISSTTSHSQSAASANAAGNIAKQLQTSSAQMQAAEKRLQMMKKKAAMKGSYKI